MTQHAQTNHRQPVTQPMLPQEGRAAIYTRTQPSQLQTSSPKTNDLVAFASEHGFSTEQITVYEEPYVSGKAALLRRDALSRLIHEILEPPPETDPIKAIFVSSEDRLFRDANATDIAVFIETCVSHSVTLITPTHTYDFTNPAHVTLFRFTCEASYQYVSHVITSRLQAGRRAAAAKRKEVEQ